LTSRFFSIGIFTIYNLQVPQGGVEILSR